MLNALLSGILGGLAAGIVLGLLLSAIVPSDVGLPGYSLMELLAGAMGAKHLALGWVVTLGVGALIGALFSAIVRRARDAGTVASVALLCCVVVWALDATIGVPLLIGARPLVGLTNAKAWPLVAGTLMLGLLFWSVLAVVVLWHRGRGRRAEVTEIRELRRAA